MSDILRSLLLVVVAAGAVFGLGMCAYSSAQGDWPIALISAFVYSFSLVMAS